MTKFIHLPGIGNSGPDHWHSLWEKEDAFLSRFTPSSWDEPTVENWVEALETAVLAAEEPPVLVAHSLACLLVAHWQARSTSVIKGAFLVAVPDPSGALFPAQAASFDHVPDKRFSFPSLIVASTNDPYGSLSYAKACAAKWGSELEVIGAKGHINDQSGLGVWPEGQALLADFVARLP